MQKNSKLWFYSLWLSLVFGCLCILLRASTAHADPRFFTKSYAVVVGINDYRHSKWPKLTHAVRDARAISAFLRGQGFEVTELYEKDATRQAIVTAVEDTLGQKVTTQDRVAFYFAGHGDTRNIGEDERGYLVPYDGTNTFASLLSMNQIRDFSSILSRAKHQLFILDACFGGLLGNLRGSPFDPELPNYIDEITKRRARQVLTAGGANQRVRDVGPGGHSLFTGQLLNALNGAADRNTDGYITFTELASYMQHAASAPNQTPGSSELSGHESGDFVFVNPNSKPKTLAKHHIPIVRPSLSRSESSEVYQLVKTGKQLFSGNNYTAARDIFLQAGHMGSAEAMLFLGKMAWEGWGGPVDSDESVEWFRAAAERGEIIAMQNLVDIFTQMPQYQNLSEAARWQTAVTEMERMRKAGMIIASGDKQRDDVAIIPQPPAAPTSLRLQ